MNFDIVSTRVVRYPLRKRRSSSPRLTIPIASVKYFLIPVPPSFDLALTVTRRRPGLRCPAPYLAHVMGPCALAPRPLLILLPICPSTASELQHAQLPPRHPSPSAETRYRLQSLHPTRVELSPDARSSAQLDTRTPQAHRTSPQLTTFSMCATTQIPRSGPIHQDAARTEIGMPPPADRRDGIQHIVPYNTVLCMYSSQS